MLPPAVLGLPSKFVNYRPKQFEVALDIAAATRRFSLFQGSVGSGKTLTLNTVAKLHGGRALTLVGTKSLQDQACADFPQLKLIKGSDNYRCTDSLRSGKSTCAADSDGSTHCRWRRRVIDGERVDTQCPYLNAQREARESDSPITNYAYHLALGQHDSQAIGSFDLLLADESHGILGWLTDACAITFTAVELRALSLDAPPVTPDAPQWLLWSLAAVEVVKDAYRTARDRHVPAKRLNEIADLGKRCRALLNASTAVTADGALWVCEGTRIGARYVPVWPGAYAEEKLWRGVPRVVLSSATLTHEDAKHLGLTRNDYTWHEVDSGFEAARCPFYYLPVARVDKGTSEGTWKLVVNEMDRFIGPRLALGRRGVIQATSYDWADKVVKYSRYAEQMVTHKRHNARDTVRRFERMEGPPILVSPVVREGHDFLNSVCRFQVIVKLPSPNSQDAVIRARCASDKSYRNHLTARTLEQQVGRGMRTESDWCESLIVDTHFGDWFRYRGPFTASFKATWRQVETSPPPLVLE